MEYFSISYKGDIREKNEDMQVIKFWISQNQIIA